MTPALLPHGANGCPKHHRERAAYGLGVVLQRGHEVQERPLVLAQRHTMRVASHQQIGSRLYRRPRSMGMAVASVRDGHVARGPPPVLPAFAGVRIGDEPLGQRQRHQRQTAMPPVGVPVAPGSSGHP